MEPEEVTADKPIMERLQEIAKTIDGNEGKRIRKMRRWWEIGQRVCGTITLALYRITSS